MLVLGLTTGTILQDCTRSFVAHKKLENVSEENEKKLIYCPRKSLIFQDFQGPTHIFQVFQAWILKFQISMTFQVFQDTYEPWMMSVICTFFLMPIRQGMQTIDGLLRGMFSKSLIPQSVRAARNRLQSLNPLQKQNMLP